MIVPNLKPGADIEAFVQLMLKPAARERFGLGDLALPIRREAFEELIAGDGRLEPDHIVRCVMDWLDQTGETGPYVDVLRQMIDDLLPDDHQAFGRCHLDPGDGAPPQRFYAAPVDLDEPLVAFQRGTWVIAVAQASQYEEGRVDVASFGAMTNKTAAKIVGYSTTSFMSEPFDSFAGLMAAAGKTNAFYSWEQDAVTVINWDYGLGRTRQDDGSIEVDEDYLPYLAMPFLPNNQAATLIAMGAGYG